MSSTDDQISRCFDELVHDIDQEAVTLGFRILVYYDTTISNSVPGYFTNYMWRKMLFDEDNPVVIYFKENVCSYLKELIDDPETSAI